jgi:hypothetical protein
MVQRMTPMMSYSFCKIFTQARAQPKGKGGGGKTAQKIYVLYDDLTRILDLRSKARQAINHPDASLLRLHVMRR